jgi:hypothetical protein
MAMAKKPVWDKTVALPLFPLPKGVPIVIGKGEG